MLQKRVSWMLAALTAMALAGCGGHSSSTPINTSPSQVTVTPTGGFNGDSSTMHGGTATTTTVGGNTVATITDGGRTLTITMPETAISSGDAFHIGNAGAAMTYTESASGGGTAATWTGLSGRVSVNPASAGHASVTLDSIHFAADSTVSGNPAAGTFTLNGTVAGLPVTAGAGPGGASNVGFSGASGTNADTSAFTSPTIAFNDVSGTGTLTATTGAGASQRTLRILVTPSFVAGDNIDLTGSGNTSSVVTLTQGTGAAAKIWYATGGNIRVDARTSNRIKIHLTDAVFTNPTPATNDATGTFVVNGTIDSGP